MNLRTIFPALLATLALIAAGGLAAEEEAEVLEATFRNPTPKGVTGGQQSIEVEFVLTNRSKEPVVIEWPRAYSWRATITDAKGKVFKMNSFFSRSSSRGKWPKVTMEPGDSQVVMCELRPVSIACINCDHALFLPQGVGFGPPVGGKSVDWVYPIKLTAQVSVSPMPKSKGELVIETKELTLLAPGKGSAAGQTDKP